jgi:hypothetical protein
MFDVAKFIINKYLREALLAFFDLPENPPNHFEMKTIVNAATVVGS